jgi:hypothetical protein
LSYYSLCLDQEIGSIRELSNTGAAKWRDSRANEKLPVMHRQSASAIRPLQLDGKWRVRVGSGRFAAGPGTGVNAIQHRSISRTIFRPGNFPGRFFVLEISIIPKNRLTSKQSNLDVLFAFFVENRVFYVVWPRSQHEKRWRYVALKFATDAPFFSQPTDVGFHPPWG